VVLKFFLIIIVGKSSRRKKKEHRKRTNAGARIHRRSRRVKKPIAKRHPWSLSRAPFFFFSLSSCIFRFLQQQNLIVKISTKKKKKEKKKVPLDSIFNDPQTTLFLSLECAIPHIIIVH